ncbi:MATE family efflux transporter [Zhongshania aliphaticivorans]|nr:MATE family efflux transporter [Zhongshania aliphaticivorans]
MVSMRSNLAVAWPLAFNALLVQSMLMIDTLLVAPLGELSVAAMGIASTVVAFVLGIKIAIGNGIQLLIGRAHGRKKQDELAVVYWVGLFVNVTSALVFFFVLSVFGSNLVAIITNDAELAEVVERYIAISKYVILITAYTQVCTAFYNGRGSSTVPLKGFLIELPFNVLLSYILINGFWEFRALGVEGAAWGSVAAVLLRAIFLYFSLRAEKGVDLCYPRGQPFLAEVQRQSAEIFPIAANFFVISVGVTVYQLLYAQLDLIEFVAITLLFPWLRAGTQFTNAWAQAAAISLSQAMGGRFKQDLNVFVKDSVKIGMVLSMIIAGLFLLLSQCLPFIYSDVDADTHRALATIAPLYIALPVLRAYNTVSGNILRALGESSRVLKIHFITQWLVSLPLCALLILYFDVSIFWAFAMIPLEELFKTIPFYKYKRLSMSRVAFG